MEIKFNQVTPQELDQLVQFSIIGMHFAVFFDNDDLTQLYGQYFVWSELQSATSILVARDNGQFLGAMFIRETGKQPQFKKLAQHLASDQFAKLLNADREDYLQQYDQANAALLKQYLSNYQPAAEILLLATNPTIQRRGLGSQLLTELSSLLPGQEVYLYTDDQCSYQFYDHRGFSLDGKKLISYEAGTATNHLNCFLYRKRL